MIGRPLVRRGPARAIMVCTIRKASPYVLVAEAFFRFRRRLDGGCTAVELHRPRAGLPASPGSRGRPLYAGGPSGTNLFDRHADRPSATFREGRGYSAAVVAPVQVARAQRVD